MLIMPIRFKSISIREGSVPPPNTPYSPIIFDSAMMRQTPCGEIAYFDWCCKPTTNFDKAKYVVHPSDVPAPPGFRWYGGTQPLQEVRIWQANAEVLSRARYLASEQSAQLSTPQLVPKASAIVPPSSNTEIEEQEEQLSLVETPQGYAIISSKNHRKTRATNYLLRDVTMVHYLKNEKDQNQLSVRLTIELVSPPAPPEMIEIAISELDSVGTKIGKQIGAAIVYPGVKGSFFGQFSILVRERLAHCQHQYIYLSTGWALLPQGQWVYVHDGGKPPYNNIVFRTGFKFGAYENKRSTNWLTQNAWRLLDLSQDKTAILIPFLFAHLSLLWSLFNAGGYPPHMLLFIKGATGSLKTAVASLLFNFSGESRYNIPASFRDTSASMEVKMEKYRDRVLLVDDFCPAASENARRVLEQNLEQLVRFYGDGIAKARTNPKLEEVTEKRPQGLCAITGEDSAGSFSSLLRCLFIAVDPNTYDKALLAEFQSQPAVWTEYLGSFVDYCVNNAPRIVNLVESEFPTFRELGGKVITERRLADAYADLCLVCKIMLDFAFQNMVISPNQREDLFTEFNSVILSTCTQSAEEAKGADPVKIFARILIEGIEKRSILLATREEFEAAPDKFVGYQEGEYWYFWGANLYDSIRREYSLGGKRFPLSQSRLWDALYIANILVPSKPREQSGNKFEYGVKVSFGNRNRPRFIRINPSALKKFL